MFVSVVPSGVDISAVDELLEKAKKVMNEPVEKGNINLLHHPQPILLF